MVSVIYENQPIGTYYATQYASFFISIALSYFLMIWLLQWYMRDREPFQLKWVTFFWNLMLSLLSGLGSFIFLYYDPTCIFKPQVTVTNHHPYVYYVIVIFSLTKSVEFGDTMLLILKKKKIIISSCIPSFYSRVI